MIKKIIMVISAICLMFILTQDSWAQQWGPYNNNYYAITTNNISTVYSVYYGNVIYGENRPMVVYYSQPVSYPVYYYQYYPYVQAPQYMNAPLYAPVVPFYAPSHRCRLFRY